MDSADWRKCVNGLLELYQDTEIITWIEPIQPLAADGVLTLFCPNQHVVDRVQESYLDSIADALPSRYKQIVVCVGEIPRQEGGQGSLTLVPKTSGSGKNTPSPRKTQVIAQANSTRVGKDGYLPSYWSESQRGLSNYLTRSALFTANSYGPKAARPYLRDSMVRTPSNVELYVTGEELNQFDQEVYMQLLHYQRKLPLGDPIYFSLSQLCTDMGLTKSGRNTGRLTASLDRLWKARIELKSTSEGGVRLQRFAGNLISSFFENRSETSSRWMVHFSKNTLDMMSYESITFINLAMDRQLSSELAKYMHRFLSTHRNPLPYKLETYYELSGSRIATLNNFRKKMRAALQELVNVGFLEYWTIDDHDKVHVLRAGKKLIESSKTESA